MSLLSKSAWLACILALACGGESVIVPNGTTSASTSGSGGAGGESTTTDTSVTTTTSVTSSSTGGSGPTKCSGWDDPGCGLDEWCDTGGESCGDAGECKTKPQVCDEDCPGVCGCNGMTYCNECKANAAGVPIAADASCPSSSAFSAQLWLGGLDHVIVGKKDSANDICLLLFADWPGMSLPEYKITTPMSWGVTQITATSKASDCDTLQGAPQGEVATATAATGSLSWTVPSGKNYACELDLDVSLTFNAPPAWLGAMQSMKASMINITGGCI